LCIKLLDVNNSEQENGDLYWYHSNEQFRNRFMQKNQNRSVTVGVKKACVYGNKTRCMNCTDGKDH
jgi:hypothetical protein